MGGGGGGRMGDLGCVLGESEKGYRTRELGRGSLGLGWVGCFQPSNKLYVLYPT